MSHPSRISAAARAGLIDMPGAGIVVFDAPAGADLDDLPQVGTTLVGRFKPDVDALRSQGWAVVTEPPTQARLAIVFAGRVREATRAAVAAAAAITEGAIVVTGQKTDGIEGVLRDLKGRGTLSAPLSKAHGKLAVVTGWGDLSDWAGGPREVAGFVTAPGVFSADGPDPASVALADALPPLKGRVADLGAGWGYLAARVASSSQVSAIDLVEADLTALDCARQNVTDPRAAFHWADASTWGEAGAFDHVVTNPPFHLGRRADPALGAAFIANAARLLRRSGTLWLVANRHLPYEKTLAERFRDIDELPGTSSFKLYRVGAPIHGGRR